MPSKFSPNFQNSQQEDIFYILTMFPYPSGIGLHAWHASIFSINDVIARYLRAQWKTVFNPFGFDAFGLPTENYALQTWQSPREVTDTNKANFLTQLEALNLSFDRDRILDTSTPEYYKRTQWLFQELYKAWLVYRDSKFVNRCPHDQTVLANDQVVSGCCERCKTEVTQKEMMQWFIKVTDYAERLIQDLDMIDWPEETKIMQTNRIWRSEWVEVDFQVWDKTVTVFTTRPDTLYGVTALVLAPENTVLDKLLDEDNKQQVIDYRNQVLTKTAIERQQDDTKKTGVFSWLYARHPLTGQDIAIWYADYVLMDYGSGAVMMVPAHDERDREFAKKFDIEVKQVITTDDQEIIELPFVEAWILINSDQFDGLNSKEAQTTIIDYLEEQWYGRRKINYKLRDWSVSRQRYRGSPIPIYYTFQDNEDGKYTADNPHPDTSKWIPHLIPQEELPVLLPLDVEDFNPQWKSPLEDHPTFKYYHKDWQIYLRECDTLDTFMDSSFYFLRFPDTHNTEALISQDLAKKVLPVNLYTWGKEHTVGHLIYSRFIHKFLYDQWLVSTPEPFQKLIHQWMVLGSDGRKMGKRYGNWVDPLDVIATYGADALRTYLMFMGPVESDKARNDNALSGVKKFLDKVETIMTKDRFWQSHDEVTTMLHTTIRDITSDFNAYKFNTAVSKLMILNNTIYDKQSIAKSEYGVFAQLLAPFAPTLAAKMWKTIWQTTDVDFASWPVHDESKIITQTIEFPIQINGKMRGTLEVNPDVQESELLEIIQNNPILTKYLGDTIIKVIFVPWKIMNIISK